MLLLRLTTFAAHVVRTSSRLLTVTPFYHALCIARMRCCLAVMCATLLPQLVKALDDFYRSKANTDGHDGRCKLCDAIQCVERRRKKARIDQPTVAEKVRLNRLCVHNQMSKSIPFLIVRGVSFVEVS